MNVERILVTGVAGFIGAYLAKRFCADNPELTIIGFDNINDYYDTKLKEHRLSWLEGYDNFEFVRGDLANRAEVEKLFKKYNPQIVINLAAQPGARNSIDNPDSYIESNIIGFYNILEACRNHHVEHLIFASSSSVYGNNKKVPFSTEDRTDGPVSLYAATKKSDEVLAYAYAKLYKIPTTGLRFFSVYGPAGRPDMAYFGFTDKFVKGEKIKIFNYGKCKRDFTYIDDIVEGIVRIVEKKPKEEDYYKIYNIGNSATKDLMEFVKTLQEELVVAGVLPKDYDFDAHTEFMPMQPGDALETFADVSELEKDFGFRPETSLRDGLRSFAKWYKEYYML
ncbi:GDP-mannose 4,6-dehydratase [Candidatus Saccharibacteria bacterium]|nr:GDP-mannose 4,6-dehydratase [Candidatus Saccharibacteria bacterium]